MIKAINQRLIFVSALLIPALAFGISGCRESDSSQETAKVPDAVRNLDLSKVAKPTFNGIDLYTGPYRTPKQMPGLTIIAYNYTDTYIDSFTVNGAGGGNLDVSTATSYGGGTCCARIPSDFLLPMTVEIAWNRDDTKIWCQQTVLLDGPIPAKPNDFEVHFYQDGSIQVAITDTPSKPRFDWPSFSHVKRKASGNIVNDERFSTCGSRP